MHRVTMGIDVGTSAVKVVLVDPRGVTVAQSTVALALDRPVPEAAEQRAEDWTEAAKEAVRLVRAAAPDACVEAVGLTGQKHALLVLDGEDRPLGSAWLWADGRAKEEARHLARRVPTLFRRTGAPALPGYLVPKWHAWRRLHPQRAREASRLCFAKDWIRLALTREHATDPTEACSAQVQRPGRQAWSVALGELLDLDLGLLPPILRSQDVTGEVVEGSGFGLDAGVPVVGGAGDNEAAALACGAHDAGLLSIVLGTSGTLIGRVPRRRVPAGLVVGETGVGRGVLATGVVLAAGRSLEWVRDLAFPAGAPIEDVVAAAASLPSDAGVPLFSPSLAGARSPVPDAGAEGAFVGMTPTTGREHLARAVLEGVAAHLGRTVDLFQRAGAGVTELRLTSGGAASSLFRALVIAAAGLPARVVAARDGSARGAALLAATRGGSGDDVKRRVQAWDAPGDVEVPDPALVRRLQEVQVRQMALEAALLKTRNG